MYLNLHIFLSFKYDLNSKKDSGEMQEEAFLILLGYESQIERKSLCSTDKIEIKRHKKTYSQIYLKEHRT